MSIQSQTRLGYPAVEQAPFFRRCKRDNLKVSIDAVIEISCFWNPLFFKIKHYYQLAGSTVKSESVE